jgi:DNA-binding protein HU-beta
VNKTDLIDHLAELMDGNKKSAQTAVEGIIDVIQREVQKGQNVTIAGFGVFEKRQRAARTARNPRTGEMVKVKKTTIPVFRPGKYFKDVVAGTVKLPKPTGQPISARAAAAAGKATAATAARTTTRAPRSTAAPNAAGTTAPRTRAAAKTATTTRPTRVRATEMNTTATAAAAAPTTRAPRTAAIKAEVAATTTAVKKPATRRARAMAE